MGQVLYRKGVAMDRTQLRQGLLDILESETGQQFPSLDDTTSLYEGLGLDSVDVVSIVMQIESRFRIRLPSADLQKVVVIGELLDLVASKLTAARPAA